MMFSIDKEKTCDYIKIIELNIKINGSIFFSIYLFMETRHVLFTHSHLL